MHWCYLCNRIMWHAILRSHFLNIEKLFLRLYNPFCWKLNHQIAVRSNTWGTHFWQAKVRWGAKHSPFSGNFKACAFWDRRRNYKFSSTRDFGAPTRGNGGECFAPFARDPCALGYRTTCWSKPQDLPASLEPDPEHPAHALHFHGFDPRHGIRLETWGIDTTPVQQILDLKMIIQPARGFISNVDTNYG